MNEFNLSDEQRELAESLGLSDEEMEHYFFDDYDDFEDEYELEDDDLWDDGYLEDDDLWDDSEHEV